MTRQEPAGGVLMADTPSWVDAAEASVREAIGLAFIGLDPDPHAATITANTTSPSWQTDHQ